jgi:hypothetical protein
MVSSVFRIALLLLKISSRKETPAGWQQGSKAGRQMTSTTASSEELKMGEFFQWEKRIFI